MIVLKVFSDCLQSVRKKANKMEIKQKDQTSNLGCVSVMTVSFVKVGQQDRLVSKLLVHHRYFCPNQ